MSGIMQFEFRLFGPRKGQTMVLNGHAFVNGVCRLVQSSDNMGTAAKVFSFYRAFARGTPEYDAAMAQEEAEEAPANGSNKVPEASLEGADPSVSAGVQPDGGGPSEAGSAADSAGSGDADGTDGSSGDPSGDGHEHAGVPVFPEDADYRAEEPPSQVNETIAAAIRTLDPDVDSHWVTAGARKGKPKLHVVEEAYGKNNLTIQDLEAAMPNYTRDVARAAVLAG